MKIYKFIKKNYKRLIIQVVSVISALVILSVPVFAEDSISIRWPYATDVSIRSNVTAESFGTIKYEVTAYNDSYFPDTDGDSEYQGRMIKFYAFPNDAQSIRINSNDSILVTFLLENTVVLEPMRSYTVTLPLVFISDVVNYNLKSNFIRCSFWDNGNVENPYLDFTSQNVGFTWTYNDFYKSYQNKVDVKMSNNTTEEMNINYIRLAINFSNVSQINVGDCFGFYDALTITENGKVYNRFDDGIILEHNAVENQIAENNKEGLDTANKLITDFEFDSNMGTGLLAVTNIFNTFTDVGWFNSLLQHSLIFGIFAFIVGMTVAIAKTFSKK